MQDESLWSSSYTLWWGYFHLIPILLLKYIFSNLFHLVKFNKASQFSSLILIILGELGVKLFLVGRFIEVSHLIYFFMRFLFFNFLAHIVQSFLTCFVFVTFLLFFKFLLLYEKLLLCLFLILNSIEFHRLILINLFQINFFI